MHTYLCDEKNTLHTVGRRDTLEGNTSGNTYQIGYLGDGEQEIHVRLEGVRCIWRV